ncbi:MAG: hypothetical protein QM644_20190 [Mobilitalea sp.]
MKKRKIIIAMVAFLVILGLILIGLLMIRQKKEIPSPWEEWSEKGRYYNYAPSYLQVSDSNRYLYYCRNSIDGIIKDSIFLRQSIKGEKGWEWKDPVLAIEPSASGWDSIHVCDPDVKQGEFTYRNHTYQFIMFYLGSDRSNNNHNQIGVALADNLEGPWVKWEQNPLVEYGFANFWGKGQPSAISLDKKGEMLLFYSSGDNNGTRMLYRVLDLSDLDVPVIGEEQLLSTEGLTESDGSQVILHNGALAYEEKTDRFYLIRPRHPFEATTPDYISSQLQVAYTPAATIWSGAGSWTIDGHITSEETKKARNHNSCFLTNSFGGLIGGSKEYQISFTISDINSFPESLWSYRIYGAKKDNLISN